jgi:hypothetical protein
VNASTEAMKRTRAAACSNISFLCGNWGARVGAKKGKKGQKVQQNIDDQLKKCPAQIWVCKSHLWRPQRC